MAADIPPPPAKPKPKRKEGEEISSQIWLSREEHEKIRRWGAVQGLSMQAALQLILKLFAKKIPLLDVADAAEIMAKHGTIIPRFKRGK
jgi:hypothetical protein